MFFKSIIYKLSILNSNYIIQLYQQMRSCIEAAKFLQQFINNPVIQDQPLAISSLMTIVNSRSQILIEIIGYKYCSICDNNLSGITHKLQCGHQIHKACFLEQAEKITENAFDNERLSFLKCTKCNRLLKLQQIGRILTPKYILQRQEQANRAIISQLESEDRKRRQTQLDSMKYECVLCQSEKSLEEMISLSCESETHRFCKQCIEQYVLQKMNQGKFKNKELFCPSCNDEINQYTLKNILSPNDFDRLMRLRPAIAPEGIQLRACRGYVYHKQNRTLPLMTAKPNMDEKQNIQFQEQLQRRVSGLRNGIKMPEVEQGFTQCKAIVSYSPKENANDKYIKCIVCDLEMCIKGCESSHKGNTCEKYKQWVELNKKGDQALEAAIKSAGMAKCPNPKCKMAILRASGCNWVKCRCGYEICYICSKTWLRSDPHFISSHPQFNAQAFLAKQV